MRARAESPTPLLRAVAHQCGEDRCSFDPVQQPDRLHHTGKLDHSGKRAVTDLLDDDHDVEAACLRAAADLPDAEPRLTQTGLATFRDDVRAWLKAG